MRTLVLILAVIFGAAFADQAQARGRFFRGNVFARVALANGLARAGFVFVPGVGVNETFVFQNGQRVETIDGVPAGFRRVEVIEDGLRRVRFIPVN